MPKVVTIFLLECLAVLCAWIQSIGGVRTDEAKYLLNIPYPHPPLIRWLMGLTNSWTMQEIFWRIVLATIVVQAVWIVWDIGKNIARPYRLLLCAFWLLSGGILLQAGTVMMACITAVELLVLLWLLQKPDVVARWPILVGLVWFASLMTALQAILFVFIVLAIMRRGGHGFWGLLLYVCVPILVWLLAIASNPLIPMSIVSHAGRQIDETILERGWNTLRLLLIAGSGIGMIGGIIGLWKKRDVAILASCILLLIFVAFSRYDYYAILFVPFFIVGIESLLRETRIPISFLSFLLIACVTGTVWLNPPQFNRSPARQILQTMEKTGHRGTILIFGAFGHEWQYESTRPILHYRGSLLPAAQSVICIDACPWMEVTDGWYRSIANDDMTVWEKNKPEA